MNEEDVLKMFLLTAEIYNKYLNKPGELSVLIDFPAQNISLIMESKGLINKEHVYGHFLRLGILLFLYFGKKEFVNNDLSLTKVELELGFTEIYKKSRETPLFETFDKDLQAVFKFFTISSVEALKSEIPISNEIADYFFYFGEITVYFIKSFLEENKS